MGPLIIKCTDRLTKKLDENEESEINITAFLKRFTMDTIWNCAFGLDIDLQNDLDNEYFYKSEALFSIAFDFSFAHFLSCKFNFQSIKCIK